MKWSGLNPLGRNWRKSSQTVPRGLSGAPGNASSVHPDPLAGPTLLVSVKKIGIEFGFGKAGAPTGLVRPGPANSESCALIVTCVSLGGAIGWFRCVSVETSTGTPLSAMLPDRTVERNRALWVPPMGATSLGPTKPL